MEFTAEIDVMPKKELLDPQGKAVLSNLDRVGLSTAKDVRMGKHISIKLEANSMDEANEKIDNACKKMLINPVMEYYEFTIEESK